MGAMSDDWTMYQLRVTRIRLGLPVIQSASNIVWGFAGSIQHFSYNGVQYFNLAAKGMVVSPLTTKSCFVSPWFSIIMCSIENIVAAEIKCIGGKKT